MTEGLRVRQLRVSIDGTDVVGGIDLDVAPGECVAIVGESGAGKSLTARALLGLAPAAAAVSADELRVDGVDATAASSRAWRALRGTRIALVAQDALVSLDPLRRVGAEIEETLLVHNKELRAAERRGRALAVLDRVAMPEGERRMRQYPHELSGGLRQRALIAAALVAGPRVLVADEPTTALDATVQMRILTLLRSIADAGTAVLLVSHDLAAVRRVADRIVVMRAGHVVESGTTSEVFDAPRDPYTADLLRASRPERRGRAQMSDAGDVVIRSEGVCKHYDRAAVNGATFTVVRGETLGIVGESGSGKTTLARMIVGLETPDAGRIAVERRRRGDVQLVQQNALGAFDPRWTVGRSLREALAAAGVPRGERRERSAELLREVELDPALAARRPAELSGGQRQRAALARALAANPSVLVLDEPVSALDPTVRERVLDVLERVRASRGLTMLFVSHDLDVVAAICDRVLVMQRGRIVEQGEIVEVFSRPQHPFTKELLAAGGSLPHAGSDGVGDHVE